MKNTAVQTDQAPESPRFRPSTSERLISRVLFQAPDGTQHQTSVYSTLAMDVAPGSPEHAARIEQYMAIYTAIGCKVLHMEFIDQIGWELG